ncbi:hypothetical protein GCM10007928_48770 [Sulfitobacter porphyrae]|nr:hypothetical protein GCM10007928_48770 [Sulfitobacter porphyrae]
MKDVICGPFSFNAAKKKRHPLSWQKHEAGGAILESSDNDPKAFVGDISDTQVPEFSYPTTSVKPRENQIPQAWCACFQQPHTFFTGQKDGSRTVIDRYAVKAFP